MKVLLTGTTGYIGKRLLINMLHLPYEFVCVVRDKSRFEELPLNGQGSYQVIEADFNDPDSLAKIPVDIDFAYYLMHSMSSTTKDFDNLEARIAENFQSYIDKTNCRQIIYLSGIVNETGLSKHLSSRKNVEDILGKARAHLTTLRAGIIVGSGSASFEIIRDIVEKLPIMIAPKWLKSKCQPIAIRDVLQFLMGVLNNEQCFNQTFDIGGPDILSYKKMLYQFGEVRKLKRLIITVPILTPRLSSYWLNFVTSTSYQLAVNLVNSMKVDVIARPNQLSESLGIELISYKKSVELAFQKIQQNDITSSWTDAMSSSSNKGNLRKYRKVPTFGCYKDYKEIPLTQSKAQVISNIWSIGGQRGWYAYNWLWKVRGYLDKIIGGVGLRRGRTSPTEINPGDALDFWRVLIVDKKNARMLLFAEMKLPGEAWLEFKIEKNNNGVDLLKQTATFRPHGLLGRLYWYSVLPFHFFVFSGMVKNIERYSPTILPDSGL